jgi:serine/threonine protein phosphatase PrpC
MDRLEPTLDFLESRAQQACQPLLQIGLASDAGRMRGRNEDSVLVWQFALAQQGQPALPIGLFVVADGMGGHSSGQQASALAIRLAAEQVIRQLCLPLLGIEADLADRPPINEVLENSVRTAHQALLRRLPESGTTMTMALILGDSAYLVHVGDSRAYLGGQGTLKCLTQDHSVAARLMEMGQTTAPEVASQRHILYKALGQGREIEPDMIYHHLDMAHYLLLCCDGLWGMVPDDEIAAIVEAAATPACACHDLVARANEKGGDDNISVILVARGWPLPAHV